MSFSIGDEVLCQTGCVWSTWISGRIKSKKLEKNEIIFDIELGGASATSTMKIDQLRHCDIDTHNKFQVLIHHLRHNEAGDVLSDICETFGLNLSLIGSKLLLESAACGNVKAFQWLAIDNNVNLKIRDGKGRSIVQIAIYNQHDKYVHFIVDCFNSNRLPASGLDLFLMADNEDQIFLHTLVICGRFSLTEALLSRSDSKFTQFLCAASKVVRSGDNADKDHICQLKDKHGKYAIQYSSGNEEFLEVTHRFGQQTTIHLSFTQFIDSMYIDNGPLTDSMEGFAQNFVGRLFPEFGDYPLFPCVERVVKHLAYILSSEHVFESGLKWLAKTRKINLSTLRPPPPLMHNGVESYVFAPDIVTQLVRGPRRFWFHYPEIEPYLPVDTDGRKYSVCELNKVMKLCLIEFLRNWDASDESLVERFESECEGGAPHETIHNATTAFNNFELHSQFDWPLPPILRGCPEIVSIISAYICQFFARLMDKQFEQRARMLDWLHHTMKLPLPSLHLFVEYGQFRLLQHVCNNISALKAPLQTNKQLFSVAQTTDWWPHHAHACQNIDTAGFLCLVAIVHDQLSIVQWLLKITNSAAVRGFAGIMLELGAENNSYMFCKWIYSCEVNLIPDLDYNYASRDGLNASHIAAKNGYFELTVWLSDIYPKHLRSTTGLTVIDYALNCKRTAGTVADDRLIGWAETQQLYVKLSETVQSVKDTKNSVVWIGELTAIDFAGVVFEQFRLNQHSIPEYLRKFKVLRVKSILHDTHEWDTFANTASQYICHIFYYVVSMDLTNVLAFIRDQMNEYARNSTSMEVGQQYRKLVKCLLNFAKDFNKSQSIQFVSKWLTKLEGTDAITDKIKDEVLKFVDMVYKGVKSVTLLDQSVARQAALFKMADLNGELMPFSYMSLLKSDPGSEGPYANNTGKSMHFLHDAIADERCDIVAWLLHFRKHDAFYYCDGLRFAVAEQKLSLVEQLLEYGYNTYSVEANSLNVFHYAVIQAFAESWGHYKSAADLNCSEAIHSLLESTMRTNNISAADNAISFTNYNGTVHTTTFFSSAVGHVLENSSVATEFELFHAFCEYLKMDQYIPRNDPSDNPLILVILRTLFASVNKMSLSMAAGQLWLRSMDNIDDLFANFLSQLEVYVYVGMKIYEHEAAILELCSVKFSCDGEAWIAMKIVLFCESMGFEVQHFEFAWDKLKPLKSTAVVNKELLRRKISQRIRFKFVDSLLDITFDEFVRKVGSMPNIYRAKYSSGRSLLHMAAISNRPDICKYIMTNNAFRECYVRTLDGYDVSVLETAVQAGASDVVSYLNSYIHSGNIILRAFKSKYSRAARHVRRRRQQLLDAVIRIQKIYRGYHQRKQFMLLFSSRRDNIAAFHFVWSKLVSALKAFRSGSSGAKLSTWQLYKQHYDLLISSNSSSNDENSVSDKVQSVMDNITTTVDNVDLNMEIDELAENIGCNSSAAINNAQIDVLGMKPTTSRLTAAKCDNIELSSSVVKWLQSAGSKYRAMFQSRIERLVEGDRSYALSKRLQGCSYPIFETKLDVGMRILWTSIRRNKLSSILVWYVSKHDDVGRLADNIVTANKRELNSRNAAASNTTIRNDSESEECMDLRDDDILLDPNGNCPLKIYTASRGDIPLLTSNGWIPSLRLDNKQHDACSNCGTTLLLGRSGTGKTVCLSDRMTRDRLLYTMNGQQCNQLFVSRSRRLCELVKSFQQQSSSSNSYEHGTADFLTLDKFILQLEKAVSFEKRASGRLFPPENRVDYQRFCVVMAPEIKASTLDAVVLWTQIRSFLKGSLEVLLCQLKHNRVLSAEEYCSETKFAPDRCRLSPEQRRKVYSFYQQYQHRMTSDGLWDDTDRVMELLTRSKLQPLCACNGKGADYHKVYVDEVQDNTQAEIVL